MQLMLSPSFCFIFVRKREQHIAPPQALQAPFRPYGHALRTLRRAPVRSNSSPARRAGASPTPAAQTHPAPAKRDG
ncbi:MAG: hypothetical protein LBK07_01015 [Tannerella sp.]|nr:hypothetical protein [Tannerella sp.]